MQSDKFSSFFKSALSQVEQRIDKALDIKQQDIQSSVQQQAVAEASPQAEQVQIAQDDQIKAQIAQDTELVNTLRKEGEQLQAQNAKLTLLYKKMREKEALSANKLEETQQKLSDSKLIVDSLEIQLKQLTTEKASLNATLSQNQQEIKDLAVQKADLKNERNTQNAHAVKIEADIALLKVENQKLKTELTEQSSANSSEQFQQLKQQNKDLVEQVQNERLNAADFKERLLQEQSTLKHELQTYKLEFDDLTDVQRQEIGRLQIQLEALRCENEELVANQNDFTKPLVLQLEKSEQIHQQAIQKLHENEAKLYSQISVLRQEQDASQISLQQINGDLKNTQAQLLATGQVNQKLNATIDDLRLKLEDRDAQLKSLYDNNSIAKNICESLRVEHQLQLDQLKNLYEDKLATTTQSLTSEIKAKELELEQLRSNQFTHRRVSISDKNTIETGFLTISESQEDVTSQRDDLVAEVQLLKSQLKNQIYELEQLKALNFDLLQLKQQHQVALELLGEKSELCDELQQDISDMRSAYKAQLQDLVEQLNKHKYVQQTSI